MKLAQIVKLLLRKEYSKIFSFILFTICFSNILIHAQTNKYVFENTPLSEAILKISAQYNIKVAFDAEKLSALTINKEVAGNNAEEIINNLLLNTGFGYQYKHNRFLIIEQPNIIAPVPDNQLFGSVTDFETGEQLPYATIKITEKSYSIPTSANGSFYYKTNNNKIHLSISYIGYHSIDTLMYFNSQQQNCNIRLKSKLQEMDEVVVKEPKIEMVEYRNDVDFATTINPAKSIDLPSSTETDIFKALQLLPGISYTEGSSELSIRGSSGDQNLVLFDGQTLYNLSHYFGVFSSLNPNIVKDIQIYKGGYDSRYGERVSGIVDITGKTGNQLKPTVYGDLNLVSGNLATEIPINKKITFIIAGRRSYSDVYATEFTNNLYNKNTNSIIRDPQSIVSQSTPSFYFYDYNTKITYRITDKQSILLNYYSGRDFYDNSYNITSKSLNADINDNNKWNNYGISAAWQKQWNNAYYSNVIIGTSGYFNTYTNNTLIQDSLRPDDIQKYLPTKNNIFNTNNQNELSDISLSFRNSLYLNKNILGFGFLCRQNNVYYHKDADKQYVYDNINQTAIIYSLYTQDRIALSNNLTLKPGIRASFYTGNNKLYFEPRLSANYNISNKLSIRAATGRFYQFLSQVTVQQETGYNKNFWMLANDSIHPVIRSNHFIIGSTLDLGYLLFDIETYYKNFEGLQEYIFISEFLRNSDFHDFFQKNGQPKPNTKAGPTNNNRTPTNQPSYFITGKGEAYGIDFSVRYKFMYLTSWISYSISKSQHQYNLINKNSPFPAPTNQTHQVSWANMLNFGKWNFGTTLIFNTGRPYIYSTLNDSLPLTREYKRLPNYFRTDVSANYNFKLYNSQFKIGATLINIFNTNNYYDINNRKFDFESTTFSETNLIRAQRLSLNVFIHFKF
jgi:ferric enterobactin receptor